MFRLLILFAAALSLQVYAETADLTAQVRSACSNPITQPPAFDIKTIKNDVQAKLDCLYLFVMGRSGGAQTLIQNPKVREVRVSLLPIRSEIVQSLALKKAFMGCLPPITTMDQIACVGPQNKELVADVLLLRALQELTLPSVLPPLENLSKTTLDQFRTRHEAAFARLTILR